MNTPSLTSRLKAAIAAVAIATLAVFGAVSVDSHDTPDTPDTAEHAGATWSFTHNGGGTGKGGGSTNFGATWS